MWEMPPNVFQSQRGQKSQFVFRNIYLQFDKKKANRLFSIRGVKSLSG